MSARRRSDAAPLDGFDTLEGIGEPALYLKPVAISWGAEARALRVAGQARPLLDGGAWSAVEILWRAGGAVHAHTLPASALADWLSMVEPHAAARANRLLAGIETVPAVSPDCGPPWPKIMGILNVTPDSFSDGGRFADAEAAIEAGVAMREAGADIVDVGGESTRPGAEPVEPEAEIERVLPVVEGLVRAGCKVSIDTRHAAVMAAALGAGAAIINDVTALTGDPDALPFAASCTPPVVLMHMQGEPRTMQTDPDYEDVSLDVCDELQAHMLGCETAGIASERMVLDPGIGFGKTLSHNLALVEDLALLLGLGRPVLLGASRKSFIGKLDDGAPAERRLAGSLAVAQVGADKGAAILRVHDVAETRQMLRLRAALQDPGGGS